MFKHTHKTQSHRSTNIYNSERDELLAAFSRILTTHIFIGGGGGGGRGGGGGEGGDKLEKKGYHQQRLLHNSIPWQ